MEFTIEISYLMARILHLSPEELFPNNNELKEELSHKLNQLRAKSARFIVSQ